MNFYGLDEMNHITNMGYSARQGREILNIMQHLDSNNYDLGIEIYKLQKELEIDNISKSVRYFKIYEQMKHKVYRNIELILDLMEELGTDDILFCEKLQYIMNILNCDIGNIYEVNQILEISEEIGNTDYRYIQKYLLNQERYEISEIMEKFDCDEVMAVVYRKIMENLNTSSKINTKIIYEVSEELENKDYKYCQKIYNYKKDNNINELKLAERMYKIEENI